MLWGRPAPQSLQVGNEALSTCTQVSITIHRALPWTGTSTQTKGRGPHTRDRSQGGQVAAFAGEMERPELEAAAAALKGVSGTITGAAGDSHL